MKLTEIKKPVKKVVKEMTFSTAPKELQKIINDLHREAQAIYPVYKSNGKRDNDISPAVIDYYLDLKEWLLSGKKVSDFDDLRHVEWLVNERFHDNFEDESWDVEDYDEDGEDEDELAAENANQDMRSSFVEAIEKAYAQVANFLTKK